MTSSLKQKIENWSQEYCDENGIFIVDISIANTKFNVYIDTLTNVTIQQCARLNKILQAHLDEDSDVPEIYTLDVSSPGMSNPLKLPIQYQKRLNKELIITLEDDTEIEAVLKALNDDSIEMEQLIPKNKKTKEEEHIISHTFTFHQIKKALIPIKF